MALSLEEKKDLLRKMLLEKKEQTDKRYKLSYGQKSLWFLQKTDKVTHNYNTGFSVEITGKLDVGLFKKCIQETIAHHDVLKSVYHGNGAEEFWEIGDKEVIVEEIDVYSLSDHELSALIDITHKKVFDLENGPIVRCFVFNVSADVKVFLFSIHHIAFDEWSSKIIWEEIMLRYHGAGNFKIPAVNKSYHDFTLYQDKILKDSDLADFWKAYLEDHEEAFLELTGDKELILNTKSVLHGLIIDNTISYSSFEKSRIICQTNKTTLFNLTLSVFQLVVYRFFGKERFFTGIPVAGRNNVEFHHTVGYFVNLLPLKCAVDSALPFTDFLRKNAEMNNLALLHQDYPFSLMVDTCYKNRSLASHPFFNVAFTYLNQRQLQKETKTQADLHFKEYKLNAQEAAFDITFEFIEQADSAMLRLKYRDSKFSSYLMNQFSAYYKDLLDRIILRPDAIIKELLTDDNLEHLAISDLTHASLGNHKDIFKEFTAQVELNKNNCALKWNDKAKTYQELYEDIVIIASKLKQYLGEEDTNIALTVASSFPMIQGIFAILSLGMAYVPVIPELPDARFNYLIEDAGVDVILTDSKNYLATVHRTTNKIVLCIEDLLVDRGIAHENFFFTKESQSDKIAYIMYTSGSTGSPKGVPIRQQNILNLVKAQNYIQIESEDQIMQISNYSFDGSTFDIFGSLLNGATLHLISKDKLLSADHLLEYIGENSINKGFFTTALFNNYVSHNPAKFLSSFDKILFGGEQLSVSHVKEALFHVKNQQVLVHVYGPTECTTFTTFYPISSVHENAKTLPIGNAINGACISVRNAENELLPKGVMGEIHIGGTGLAKDGYLNLNSKTRDVFIPDPENHSGLLYATGDYGYMLPDGNIVFAGRRDNQIKIRGFRIELGEIEAAIYHTGKIKKVVVVARDTPAGKKMLVAAVEPLHQGITEKEIKIFLAESLPDHMVPSKICFFDELVLNGNGKIDRTILEARLRPLLDNPAPVTDRIINPVEHKVIAIWKDILKVTDIVLDDVFFELGGDSLLAMRILSRIKSEFNVEVSAAYLFEHPTVLKLSEQIEKSKEQSSKTTSIKRTNRDQYLLK